MIKPNPFTPKSGLEPKAFINREKEISFFLKKISEAKQGNINHYIINGIWGAGKTSLLRYFKLIAQEKKCFACYFLAREISENIPDIEISIHIIQSIIRGIPYKLLKKDSNVFKSIKGVGIQVLGSGFNITFDADKNKIIDPQIFLLDGLLNIWKDISKHTDLLVILIDDTQNYSKAQRIFTTLKNVLSDKKLIDETKILFVLSSTIDGWKPFIKMNHPIGRFFIPRIELTNFDKENTIRLLSMILKDTGVTFSKSVKDKIYEFTNGHPFQIHAIGSALYDNQNGGKVTDAEWQKGFEEGLFYLGNAVYEGILESISEKEIEIIKILNPIHSNKIADINRKLKIKGINVYLRRLVDKGILKVQNRGEYFICDRILLEYIQRK